MDDIFCNTKNLLFKHCCYCFVRWTVYHLSFCRKENKQYKYNHFVQCHNHRRQYQQNIIRRHFTESLKTITSNATFTDVNTDRILSVGVLSAGKISEKITDGLCEFQSAVH